MLRVPVERHPPPSNDADDADDRHHDDQRLCPEGWGSAKIADDPQVVETLDVPPADHDTVTAQASEQISSWFAARFAGDPPVDDC